MQGKIIDFHTHPYFDEQTHIGQYIDVTYKASWKDIKSRLTSIGIEKICGSVIKAKRETLINWEQIRELNDLALKLRDLLGDFYIPGYHVHPDYIDNSIKEINRMESEGVNLIGELVPMRYGWQLDSLGFDEILTALDGRQKVLSFHATGNSEKANNAMDILIEKHKSISFVGAHFGEKEMFLYHLSRMEKHPNYYLDTSGTGLFRYGALAYGIKRVGKDRFLMGSDFAVCEPSMYVGGIMGDEKLTKEEKSAVLYENAKRLLKL